LAFERTGNNLFFSKNYFLFLLTGIPRANAESKNSSPSSSTSDFAFSSPPSRSDCPLYDDVVTDRGAHVLARRAAQSSTTTTALPGSTLSLSTCSRTSSSLTSSKSSLMSRGSSVNSLSVIDESTPTPMQLAAACQLPPQDAGKAPFACCCSADSFASSKLVARTPHTPNLAAAPSPQAKTSSQGDRATVPVKKVPQSNGSVPHRPRNPLQRGDETDGEFAVEIMMWRDLLEERSHQIFITCFIAKQMFWLADWLSSSSRLPLLSRTSGLLRLLPSKQQLSSSSYLHSCRWACPLRRFVLFFKYVPTIFVTATSRKRRP